jgi:tetratricopeptide (TPR) repeat protein
MLHVLVMMMLWGTCLWAADTEIQKLEKKITAEMESLIDKTGKISEEDNAACKKLVMEGIQEHDKGDYRKAIALYERAITKNPLAGYAYYEMAYAYSESGDQRKALEFVLRSLVLDPKSEGAYIMKASRLDDLGLVEDAINAYKKIIEIKPDSLGAHLNLGITFLRKGDLDSAKNEFMKAHEIQPNHPSPYLRLSQVASAKKETYEEERYLNEFLRVGKNDPRLPAVQKRLKELNTVNIQINMPALTDAAGSANGVISIIEGGARSLWLKEKHRKTFPDAKAYSPSFEEEKDVLMTLLPVWKEQKSKNSSVSNPVYDLAVAAEQAGYLDAYVWYMNRQKLGAKAESWIKENKQKVDVFTEWAARSGYQDQVKEKDAKTGDATKNALSLKELPELFMKIAMDSKLAYAIGTSKQEDGAKFRQEEGKRFQEALKKTTTQCLNKEDARLALKKRGGATDFSAGVRVFMPKDEEWDSIVKMSSNFGRRYVDLAPPMTASGLIEKKGDKIIVQASDPAWIIYYLAKALWRYEPGFRQRFGGSDQDIASVMEEELALAALAGGNQNRMESKDNKMKADPYIEKIEPILGSEDRKGFILLEILHKTYGASLECLTPDQANAVQHYFYARALEPLASPNK